MITDDTQIDFSLDILREYWNRNTLESLPETVKEDQLFKKKLNHLKLKYGTMSDGDLDDDEYIIVTDIQGNRSRIRCITDKVYSVGDKVYVIICTLNGEKSIIKTESALTTI